MAYNDQIIIPRHLYDWAGTKLPVAHFDYCITRGYIEVQTKFKVVLLHNV